MSGKRALTANHRHDTGCLDEGRSAEPPFPTSSLPRRSRPASLLFSRLKPARHAMQKARRMAWPRAIPWWSVRDLNPRPCACKAPALPLRQPTLRARRPCVPDGPPPKCPSAWLVADTHFPTEPHAAQCGFSTWKSKVFHRRLDGLGTGRKPWVRDFRPVALMRSLLPEDQPCPPDGSASRIGRIPAGGALALA